MKYYLLLLLYYTLLVLYHSSSIARRAVLILLNVDTYAEIENTRWRDSNGATADCGEITKITDNSTENLNII